MPAIKQALAANRAAVVVAEPGAGKTTRVPLALLNEPWLAGRKIVMLEPRRLAARTVSRYMAKMLGEPVGVTVGYRIHRDTCVSPKTRLEVVTEGVLTRMLQSDPAMLDVGLIIFDEFHERSLAADLGLALAIDSQEVIREDLKILVMSATMEPEPVAGLMGGVPVITSEGRSFPVTTFYLPQPAGDRLYQVMAGAVRQALARHTGDILVFLPGLPEIKKMTSILAGERLDPNIKVFTLYGDLSAQEQDEVLLPAAPGQRKIVLATSIAETSLTVEGITVVIDSGLMRVSRFSPRTGMSRLVTLRVTRPTADQRRGRAGRLGPGYCYRMWTEAEDRCLVPQNTPEILEADLAQLCLELAAWGVTDPTGLKWLDMPPRGAYAQAQSLLQQLGALDDRGKITAYGRQLVATGLQPRLAHILVKGTAMGRGAEASCLAALLSNKDIIRLPAANEDADIRLRLAIIQQASAGKPLAGDYPVDKWRVQQVCHEAAHIRSTLGIQGNFSFDINKCGSLLALAYPDRIGQNKGQGRFLLSNGRRAFIGESQLLAKEPFIVAADLADSGVESRIFLAAPVTEAELRQNLAEQIEETEEVSWDKQLQAVRAIRYQRLGALVLKEEVIVPEDPEKVLSAMLQGIRSEGLGLLPWTKSSRLLQDRMAFMHELDPTWPDVSEANLLATLDSWLAPHLYGIRNAQQLQQLSLDKILLAMLTWEQRQRLEKWAPTHITVPSGRRVVIDYSDPRAPVLAVKLQEMFGCIDTPVIGGGKVPLTIHLLSPAGRPVQITKDLAGFWRESYFVVKKELKGKYPKHYWPDDPWQAIPTSRLRP